MRTGWPLRALRTRPRCSRPCSPACRSTPPGRPCKVIWRLAARVLRFGCAPLVLHMCGQARWRLGSSLSLAHDSGMHADTCIWSLGRACCCVQHLLVAQKPHPRLCGQHGSRACGGALPGGVRSWQGFQGIAPMRRRWACAQCRVIWAGGGQRPQPAESGGAAGARTGVATRPGCLHATCECMPHG